MGGENKYLFHDSIYVMNSIRNINFWRRRATFPLLEFNNFGISFPGGDISWKSLHNLHDKEKSNSSNLKKKH